MRPDNLRTGGLAILAALALAVAACGGSGQRPLRIGVIVDCQGAYRAMEDDELAGAQLPLIARGARRRGNEPNDGLQRLNIAGRPVEIVQGCTESGEFSTLTQAARLLVVRKHVDVVVDGGAYTVDGIALRTVAALYPDVVFVAAANGPREVTLDGPRASLYRVAADYGQGVAGLATYAYQVLGWRRAAIAIEHWTVGWSSETAFVREFCALGGRVTQRVPIVPGAPADAGLVSRKVDGVAVLASSLVIDSDFLRALAHRLGDPARRIVLGPEIIGNDDMLAGAGRSMDGVVGASYEPPLASTRGGRSYLRDFVNANPGAGAAAARNALVLNYRDAVEAVVEAFKRAHGDLGDGRRQLRAQLGRLSTRLLGVPSRIDAHGQAIVSTTLVRIRRARTPSGPSLAKVRTVGGVDQSIGGLVPARYIPTHLGQACRRATPPPWAR